MKLCAKSEKTTFSCEIYELEMQVKLVVSECNNITNDRIKLFVLEKKANLLRHDQLNDKTKFLGRGY